MDVIVDTSGQAPGTFDYAAATEEELKWLALHGDQEAFNLLVQELTTVSAFHQRGKHNQKTHAGGRASYPEGWADSNTEELRTAWTNAIQKRRQHRGEAPVLTKIEEQSMMETILRAPGTAKMEVYRGPNDSFIYTMNGVKMRDADRDKLMTTVTELSTRFPVPGGVRIAVDIDGAFHWGVAGETVRGTGEMHLNEAAWKPSWANDKQASWPVLVGSEGPLRYVTTHEWGHTQDHLSDKRRDDISIKAMFSGGEKGTVVSAYALMGGPVEGYADAFADFAMTWPGEEYTYGTSTATWAKELGWK
jgi:hypothetical protein